MNQSGVITSREFKVRELYFALPGVVEDWLVVSEPQLQKADFIEDVPCAEKSY